MYKMSTIWHNNSRFGCESNLSKLPHFDTERGTGTPTIPIGKNHTSSFSPTLQMSWSLKPNPKDGYDYILESNFCQSMDPLSKTYRDDINSDQSQMISDQLNPATFQAFLLGCSSRFVDRLPSLVDQYDGKRKLKTSAKMTKDNCTFADGMRQTTKNMCTILYSNMINANKAINTNKAKKDKERKPPGVVYFEPAEWSQKTEAGMDQAEAIRSSNHHSLSSTKSASKALQNVTKGTIETLDEQAKLRVFWRQRDGSLMLIGVPKKYLPPPGKSRRQGEGSRPTNAEDNGGDNLPSGNIGTGSRLDPEDDLPHGAWTYLQGKANGGDDQVSSFL